MTLSLIPRLASAGLLLLMTGACASPPSAQPASPTTPTPTTDAGKLWQQIEAVSASAPCDNDSQCHTIGTGARACGGPERYLPWSSKQDDGAALRQLVARHAAMRRAEDQRDAMMSTCSVVSDPGASCRASRCTLNSSPPGGGANVQ